MSKLGTSISELIEKWGVYVVFITGLAGVAGLFFGKGMLPYLLLFLLWIVFIIWLWIYVNPKKQGEVGNDKEIKVRERKTRQKKAGIIGVIFSLIIFSPIWFPALRASAIWPIYVQQQPKEKFVVVVARFTSDTFPIDFSKSTNAQEKLFDDLARMLLQQNLRDEVTIITCASIYSERQAENVGKLANADIVIWGDVLSEQTNLMRPNFKILGENDELSMTDPRLFNMQVSSDAMLTNRAKAVTSFVLGIYYLDNETEAGFRRAKDVLSVGIDDAKDEYESNKDYRKDISYNLALLHFTRGRALAALGQEQEAVDDFNVALEYGPSYKRAYVALGNIYYIRRELDAAKTNYEKAAAEWSGLYGLGLVSYFNEDYVLALDYFTKALAKAESSQLNPNGSTIMKIKYGLGMTHLMLGDITEASVFLAEVCQAKNIPSSLQYLGCNPDIGQELGGTPMPVTPSMPTLLPTGVGVPPP
jgi:tetratricopeptide (TPR) repeat protein